MNKFKLIVVLCFAILLNSLIAQTSAPNVESVYGGRINAITGHVLSPHSSRIFISTESANSVFYTDIHCDSTGLVFSNFTVMPGLDDVANYGANIKYLASHKTSGFLFFLHDNGLLSSHPSFSTVNTIDNSMHFTDLLIQDSVILYTGSNNINFGLLDGGANYTKDTDSPISFPTLTQANEILINPNNDLVYLCQFGNNVRIVKSSDEYYNLSSSTTFTDISPSSLTASIDWRTFGIAPDGRLFLAGLDGEKYIAYSDDESSWTEYNTGLGGASSDVMDFMGDSSSYTVFYTAGYNSNNGLSGSWEPFGITSFETHPNDGAVFTDPVNSIVYMTTDQGLGVSENGGSEIYEINDGIEAVQVNDFDMVKSKTTAWVASKSGIRKVSNYLTSPTWTNAIFPNGDGSPYHSVDMFLNDTNTVYAGNVRVYKSVNSGENWNSVFSASDSPYNFSSVWSIVNAIEVCDYDSNIVFAGYYQNDSVAAGLFYSQDGGNNWDQLLVKESVIGHDIDVNDIIFNIEGTDTVAYVGVEYDVDYPAGYSVYRIVKNGSIWTPSQDMSYTKTSTGSVIVVSIKDLELSESGDTVYAVGTDAGTNHPTVYYKPINSTNLWTPVTISGFPIGSNLTASAVTIGNDTLYCAVGNDLYYYPIGGSGWILGYSYPEGTEINVLYYDELLVGTGTGLYGHKSMATTAINESNYSPHKYKLFQNYPNPFNPVTTIEYFLPKASEVNILIYDLLGRKVATIKNKSIESSGFHSIQWDASNLASGIYFYKIKAGNFVSVKKSILLK
ncbi:MAG: T9SS type A sorting domain-containing protein [Candidatus Marinimicrobia bacterium]|nr:T9SS type A sorting domain-containing protein [Candidatus Neomarinimicrobiota bacterium]